MKLVFFKVFLINNNNNTPLTIHYVKYLNSFYLPIATCTELFAFYTRFSDPVFFIAERAYSKSWRGLAIPMYITIFTCWRKKFMREVNFVLF